MAFWLQRRIELQEPCWESKFNLHRQKTDWNAWWCLFCWIWNFCSNRSKILGHLWKKKALFSLHIHSDLCILWHSQLKRDTWINSFLPIRWSLCWRKSFYWLTVPMWIRPQEISDNSNYRIECTWCANYDHLSPILWIRVKILALYTFSLIFTYYMYSNRITLHSREP